MDFASVTAFGRPAVQPSAAVPQSTGVRPPNDPRQIPAPATPLAAGNTAELRMSSGPRQSSSSSDAREHKEEAGAATGRRSHAHGSQHRQEGDRGASVDVTV